MGKRLSSLNLDQSSSSEQQQLADVVRKKVKKSFTALAMNIESDLKDVIEERESSTETEEEEDETSFKNSSPVVSNVSISS